MLANDRVRIAVAAALVFLGASLPAQAAIFPTPNPPVNSLTYGDFVSFSLAFLNNSLGFGAPNGNEPYAVDATPGAIKDLVVVMTGSAGNPVTTNGVGADDPYSSSSGGSPPNYFFRTSDGAEYNAPAGDNNPTTVADDSGLWQADTAYLRAAIGAGNQMVIYFAMNDTGSNDGTLLGQDQLAWAKIDLVDAQGNLPTKTFFLTSDKLTSLGGGPNAAGPNGIGPGTLTDAGVAGDGLIDSRWVYVNGVITVDGTTFLHTGPKTGADPATASEINQNLGADLAAFAIFNKELSDLVMDQNSGYDYVSADIRLSRLNNGQEQIWIAPAQVQAPPGVVPEPASMATWLLGLAFSGTAARWRRKLRVKS